MSQSRETRNEFFVMVCANVISRGTYNLFYAFFLAYVCWLCVSSSFFNGCWGSFIY